MAYRNYAPANSRIVDPSGNGDFTTIAAALTASSTGQTIFIRPGTYTENLTLKAGVNLTAYGTDSYSGTVTIIGKCTFTAAGTVNIADIRLQTNSDFFLAVTGTLASIVNLNNCDLNASNNGGISFTTNSSSARINCYNCTGDVGTTGIAFFAHGSAGAMTFNYTKITNTGLSTTACTVSSTGAVTFFYSTFNLTTTTSSTGAFAARFCYFSTQGINTTILTSSAGGVTHTLNLCWLQSGTASTLTITAGTAYVQNCLVQSSNTNAITGAGAINYAGLTFQPSNSTLINVTTQTGGLLAGGTFQAPSAGFIGEQLSSAIAFASAVTSTTTTVTNVTSISCTAGVWDISGFVMYTGMTTATLQKASINTTSATIGTLGDNAIQSVFVSTTAGDFGLPVPVWRQVFTATTTVYLVGSATYTVGTGKLYGKIVATRVG